MKKANIILAAIVLAGCMHRGGNDYAVVSKDGAVKAYLSLEVADTNEKRTTGLMHRESLAQGTGMIFEFDKPGYYSMWMKNTLVPLDMLFLNSKREAITLAPNRTPMSEDYINPCNVEYESRYVAIGDKEEDIKAFFDECEARFGKPEAQTLHVIEAPGGTIARYDIRLGDKLVSR